MLWIIKPRVTTVWVKIMLVDWILPSLRGMFVERRQKKLERTSKKKEAKWQAKTAKLELKAAKMDYCVVKHEYKSKKRQLRHNRKQAKRGFKRMPDSEPSVQDKTNLTKPVAGGDCHEKEKKGEHQTTVPPPSYEDVTGELPSYEMATQPLYPVLM